MVSKLYFENLRKIQLNEITSFFFIKFGHSEKAHHKNLKQCPTCFDIKRQIMWKIVSNFVAFLENLDFTMICLLNATEIKQIRVVSWIDWNFVD